MNERIKELEKQAIEYANQQNTFDPRSEFSKKFAELIVGKCLSIMDRHYDASIASDEIKQHFGVEE